MVLAPKRDITANITINKDNNISQNVNINVHPVYIKMKCVGCN